MLLRAVTILPQNKHSKLYGYALCLRLNRFVLCCLAESGDMAGRHAGLHSGRREGQPWLEALDRRRQTLPGGFDNTS